MARRQAQWLIPNFIQYQLPTLANFLRTQSRVEAGRAGDQLPFEKFGKGRDARASSSRSGSGSCSEQLRLMRVGGLFTAIVP
eukprot:COSAG06_NODE_1236_length_10137_cov_3.357342_2_plen_82_part_00